MTSNPSLYEPSYSNSHAVVIGINKYLHINPLAFATNDARAVAEALIKRFKFPRANVSLLLDGGATKTSIMKAYLRFADEQAAGPNDRILIFFAGHGHTVVGRRETGFLVPVDGVLDDLSTLIRWDELTRDADLISAKHILFLMDACYGGLAVTRETIPPGSSRYLEDMLMRATRQVITAGKGDEVVSDGNGTRPKHSIFTSHLLDAFDGAAKTAPGIMTAMGVMAYVYEKVGMDTHSQQTPHFGFIDGDGDFIFEMPDTVGAMNQQSGGHSNTLIKFPFVALPNEPMPASVGDRVKALLPNAQDRIQLDDFVTDVLKRTTGSLSPKLFPAQSPLSEDLNSEFVERIKRYEDAVSDIEAVTIELTKWAEPNQFHLIDRIFVTLAESDMSQNGLILFTKLAWYPIASVMYAAGISALSASRYDVLHRCLFAPTKPVQEYHHEEKPIIDYVVYAMTDLFNEFKRLPGADSLYAPRSEHMFTALQPIIEDHLFLGRRYEHFFDRFEILLALAFADTHRGLTTRFWGPPGRFAWKEGSPVVVQKPFSKFVNDAKNQGPDWAALKCGFFGGPQSALWR